MPNIARVSLETVIISIVTRGIAMLGAVVVARTLGPAGKGVLTYAQSMLALVLTLLSGQISAIVFQYGRRGLPFATVYGTMLKIFAAIIVPLIFILAGVALWMPGQGPLLAAAVALPLAAYVQSTRGFFLANSEVRTANIQALVAPALFTVVAAVALLAFHASLNTVLIIFVLTYAPAVGYTMVKLHQLASQRKPEPEARPVWSQLIFTAQAGSVNLVNFVNNRIDLFIILFVLGVKALGVYSVAVGIAEILWQLSGPVATAAYGSIGTLSEADAAKLTARCIRNTLPLALVVSIFTFVLAPPVVKLVFGAPFAEAGYVTRYFLPGVIAWSAMYHIRTFLTVQLGKPNTVLALIAASAVVCAVVTFGLVHVIGITSGAVGSSLGYLVGGPWAIVIFLRRSKLPARELFAFGKDDWKRYVALFSWMRQTAGAVLAR